MGQEGQLSKGGRKGGAPVALLIHSRQMERAGPETERDVPKDTQQIRLDLYLERSRGNGGKKQKQRDEQIG